MKDFESNRVVDPSWDYAKADTKEYSHCVHAYPAMMIPQIARRIIREFQPSDTALIFDPYCGTGTSLVESNLAGINACGTDLNPLARLISRVKTHPYSIKELSTTYESLKKKLQPSMKEIEEVKSPGFDNIHYWFSEINIQKLAYLKSLIKGLRSELEEFFMVALSETIRDSSYTRRGEFKLYRIPEEKIAAFAMDPFKLFKDKVERNMEGIRKMREAIKGTPTTRVFDFNTCTGIPLGLLDKEGIDMVVTSPPYGDSRTTVAYGQFSRLSNQWLGIENASKLDSLLMGGKRQKAVIQVETARDEIERIQNIDPLRGKDITSFIYDYSCSIANVAEYVRSKGVVCYVVGNRRVKDTEIPLDLITAELFSRHGFTHKKTYIRNIPAKRMPKSNSPSNISGSTANTMNNEYIVLMEKS